MYKTPQVNRFAYDAVPRLRGQLRLLPLSLLLRLDLGTPGIGLKLPSNGDATREIPGMVVTVARQNDATSDNRGCPICQFLSFFDGCFLKTVTQLSPTSSRTHSCCPLRWLVQVAASQCCCSYVMLSRCQT
jgi:hypothetical protein